MPMQRYKPEQTVTVLRQIEVAVVQPDRLRSRILLWAEEEIRLGSLPLKSGSILEAVLYRGELPRGDADTVVGTGERQARRIVSALVDKGVLVSESPRAGTVKLSRICPFCGRILLDQRLRINDLAVAAGGENAAKLLNLTVPL